ncbi:MAG: hypothetical protein IJ079_06785 [Lachnospiraceae bacterium]|nr:hypothetical protein [Lachnospiraceae bacterium]
MENFTTHIDNVIARDLQELIEQKGCVLENEIIPFLMAKHNLTYITVKGTLRRICRNPQLKVVYRRLSDELKRFYGMENTKGYPAIFCRK